MTANRIVIIAALAAWGLIGCRGPEPEPGPETLPAAAASPEPEPVVAGPAVLAVRPGRIPADGRTVASASVTGGSGGHEYAWEFVGADGSAVEPGCMAVDALGGRSALLRAGVASCELVVRAVPRIGDGAPLEARLQVFESYADSNGDGFPDAVKLAGRRDRDAFRAWFTAIADAQVELLSPGWDPANRDCAGLIRFAFVEALKVHDGEALKRYPNVQRKSRFDVARYNYPAVPILGRGVFRTEGGAFEPDDLEQGRFSEFADARALQEFNTVLMGRGMHLALPGDLLFFLHFNDPDMPYHSMIYAGDSAELGPYLVYHTGPVDGTEGRMRRVPVTDLMAWPDGRWHPVADNPHFLGVYRFRILN